LLFGALCTCHSCKVSTPQIIIIYYITTVFYRQGENGKYGDILLAIFDKILTKNIALFTFLRQDGKKMRQRLNFSGVRGIMI